MPVRMIWSPPVVVSPPATSGSNAGLILPVADFSSMVLTTGAWYAALTRGEPERLISGSDVIGGDKKIGSLLSVSGRSALALLRLDRAQEALDAGHVIEADGATLSLIKPAWAQFDMPSN